MTKAFWDLLSIPSTLATRDLTRNPQAKSVKPTPVSNKSQNVFIDNKENSVISHIITNTLECKTLVIWGKILPSTVKEKFNRAELAIVKLPIYINHVIVGLVLSDGWLEHSRKNAGLGFAQSLDHFKYLWFVFSLLSHYCYYFPIARNRIIINKNKPSLKFSTRSMPCFTELYHIFYPNGVKIIPEDIYNMLTPHCSCTSNYGRCNCSKIRIINLHWLLFYSRCSKIN